MTQRVLLFENDGDFIDTLRRRFAQVDVDVDVMEDGNEGIDHAKANRPDAIILAIELPVNGYKICNKIKKASDLKEIPLFVLSSADNAEEVFAQHRKLRTRADGYLKKPIEFDALLSAIREQTQLGTEEAPTDMGDLALENLPEDDHTVVATEQVVDDEIEAFADDAFDALVTSDEATTVGQIPPELAAKIAEESAKADAAREAEAKAAEDIPAEDIPGVERIEAPELDNAQATISQLQAQLADMTDQSAEIDRLRQQLVSSKPSVRPRSGGVSSREYLDLREELNRKEKALLDIKDELRSGEKKLSAAKDQLLEFERAKADHEAQVLQLERQVTEQEDTIDTLETDKNTAVKKGEELKQRAEHAEAKVREIEEASAAAVAAHEAALASLTSEHETALGSLREEHNATLNAKQAAADAAKEEAQAEHQKALEAASAEKATALAELTAAKEAEAEKAAEEAEAAKKAALAALETTLKAEADERASELTAASEAALAAAETAHQDAQAALQKQLEESHASAINSINTTHSNELAVLGRKLADIEGTLAETQNSLTETTAARDGLESSLSTAQADVSTLRSQLNAAQAHGADLTGKLEKAYKKIQVDDELLERTRKAGAILMGLLDEQSKNVIGEGEASEESSSDSANGESNEAGAEA